MLECRGAATECVGSLYEALGYEALQQSHQQTLQLLLQVDPGAPE